MTDVDKREPKPGDDEHVALSDPEFKDQLALVIPHLRAFGRSLSGNRDVADDLVQETLMKAWAARKRFQRSEEHTSELQSLMRISYAVFCLKKKIYIKTVTHSR